MQKNILYRFFILTLVFAIACSKPKVNIVANAVENNLPDDIEYFDLNPDDSVQSVSYFHLVLVGGWNNCTVPFPTTNNPIKNIDYDNNSIPDFKLIANHESKQVSVSGCPTLYYNSKIECLNPSDSIITQFPGFGINNPFPYPFQFGDTIKETGGLYKTAWIHDYMLWQPAGLTYSNKTYFGIKRKINNKTYYGWIQIKTNNLVGIKVYDLAINKTPGNIIKAGQIN